MNVETRDSTHRVELIRTGRYGDVQVTFFQSDGSPMARARIKKDSFLMFMCQAFGQEYILVGNNSKRKRGTNSED